MKFTIPRNAFVASLSALARVVEKRNTIPILGNVLISARKEEKGEGEGDSITLKATDLDIEMTMKLPAKVSESGGITVPAGLLHDICRKLPEGADIAMETDVDATGVVVRGGRSRFRLQGLPVEGFPDISQSDMSHSFDIAAADLVKLIEKTEFAISTEETRYYLNGIYLHVTGEPSQADEHRPEHAITIRAVATDGHRLSMMDMTGPNGAVGMPGVIIPRKTAAEIRKLCAEASGTVRLEISTRKIRVTREAGEKGACPATLTSKVIDATYPDYARVIPKGHTTTAGFEREDMARVLDRILTVSSDRSHRLRLDFENGTIKLTAESADVGTAEERLESDHTAEALTIGFNGKYLAGILECLEGKAVLARLGGPGNPAIFQDAADSPHLTILMPMRV